NFPESSFNLNLLKMVDPDLSIVLSVAINKAIRENQPVITRGVKIGSKENLRSINVIIKPYLQMQEYQHSFLFIALEEDEKLETGKSAPASESFSTAQRVIELEQELEETRSNLQALLEEVETSNEELRSANEEAISTNEELQSTNEELQSLNEELH